MAKKNLNDAIHGDRAAIRGGSAGPKPSDSWDAFFSSGRGGSGHRNHLDDVFADGRPDKTYSQKLPGPVTRAASCFHSHPPLSIPNTGLVIHGGSCLDPAVLDADLYVGFDSGMRFTQRHWPWKPGNEVRFTVPDMGAPSNPSDYMDLLKYTRERLDAGDKVHCGCIGGHGRTGMFFAALVAQNGEPDAITYVRDHYCKRVVESDAQVDFLHKHFGVKRVSGSKQQAYTSRPPASSYSQAPKTATKASPVVPVGVEKIQPMKGRGSVWGD